MLKEVIGCYTCPFYLEQDSNCIIAPTKPYETAHIHDLLINEDGEDIASTPDWCPLRSGPVTVKLVEEK